LPLRSIKLISLFLTEAKNGDIKTVAKQMAKRGRMQEAEAREILNLAPAPEVLNLYQANQVRKISYSSCTPSHILSD
jgi:hypothetical protein